VDFDLSADQVALRDAASQLLDRLADRDHVRARVGDGSLVGTLPGAGGPADGEPGPRGPAGSAAGGFDERLWAAMAEQGWLAVEIPEAEGGLGLGMVEVAVLCEQLARHTAPAPFLSTLLALHALRASRSAGDAGWAEGRGGPGGWVEGLAGGESVGCVALALRPGQLQVEERGGRALLSGRPDPSLYAPSAEVAVVVSADALFAVAVDDAKRPAPEPAMDRTRELGWLVLEETPAVRLGGPPAVNTLLDRAAAGTSAELLGSAGRAFEMAVDYAKDRVQFGKPIGSFQAVKHELADALVDLEGMRSTVYYAAWCLAADDADASLAASMAKAWCSDAGHRVLSTALQVHGGIGFTWEHDLHLYLKRNQLDQVAYGDAGWHRDRIAGILRARVREGGSIL